MQLIDYQIRETLHQGKKFLVYRAGKTGSQASYILKILDKKSVQSARTLQALKNEYHILKRIESEHVVKARDWIDSKDYAILVLEDIQGFPVNDQAEQRPFTFRQFLTAAIQMTRGLCAIHRQNIIHKDINPSNIIYNAQSGRLQIVDFDISSTYDRKVSQLGNPEHLEGTLAYISPEQSGRMNRSVDQRSDLYSLGGTFYELLTGRRPFESHDPLELVHAHLAQMPVAPVNIVETHGRASLQDRASLQIVSDIIMKLLAKNAEDRYQSAEGLLYDLEHLQKSINLTGLQDLSSFTLATRDFSGKLQIPEKLYGREGEIRQLEQAYQRVRHGNKELLLVAGYSGSGKTALVNELRKSLSRDRSFFISGKFDQLQRSIPYSALIQAFSQFCELLLTERRETLEHWKRRFLDVLGDLGKVLTDLIPPLETIVGPQAALPEVGGQEAERRFTYAFQRFLQAIAGEEHPLAIFLDDLQWADPASLKLFQSLLKDQQSRYLLFIGAYRDNEVSPAHPLMMTIQTLREQDVMLETIPVRNLSAAHLREWLSETLKMRDTSDAGKIAELAELIAQKTQGNAFFTIQFLQHLYSHAFLVFDSDSFTWRWELETIEQQAITENVVELLAGKIQTFPQKTQELLQFAACIGSSFMGSLLSVIAEISHEETEHILEKTLREQLIVPEGHERYTFTHDRIHQAAYSLIAEENKGPLHLKIGRLLLKNAQFQEGSTLTPEDSQQLFEIVNHLNLGIELIDDYDEKLRLTTLDLKAGQQARTSAAYAAGAAYLEIARRLLPDDAWDSQYELTLAIHNETIQNCYLRGDFDEMEAGVEIVLATTRNISQRAIAYEYRMLRFIAQNQPHLAAEMLVTICESLAIDFPESFGEMTPQNIELLLELPQMAHPEQQLAIRLFNTGGASALMFGRPDLLPLVTNRMLALTLESGLTPESPFVLSFYGILRLLASDLAGAYRAGEIALEFLDRGLGNDAIKVRAFSIISFYLLGNRQHYKEVCQLMVEYYPLALSVGDFEYASYILSTYLHFLSRTDTEPAAWQEQAENFWQQISQINQPMMLIPIAIERAWNTALLGKTEHPARVALDLESLSQGLPESLQALHHFSAALKQIVLSCLFGEDTTLLEDVRLVENNWAAVGIPIPYYSSDFHFYRPLGYLQLYGSAATEDDRQEYLNKVGESLAFLGQWAEFGPINVLHKYELLQAELARIQGETWKAAELYDSAIEHAHQHEYVNEAALANELAAKFYLDRHREQLAACYFQQAHHCYQRWGAIAKVKDLEERYPKYLRQALASDSDTTSSGATAAALDIHTVLKATHTLSGTVQLKSLLEQMLRIVIENAGAQRGVFLEIRDDALLIQAAGDSQGVSELLAAIPLDDSTRAPLGLLHYVARSKTQQVFDNLSKETNYANDPYVRRRQPKSAVCFPVLRQGDVTALLYLENNAVEGAFTPARLELLTMLSAQIAISLENAELYETLEERVRQRTAELRQAHSELKQTHQALAESHEEITDNINYSARIQQAVLPEAEALRTLFPEHFILLLPHSTVSGDFYWVRELEGKIVVAAVDCTGHGVTGALLSMLGAAFLNEVAPALAAEGRLEADLILNALREKVKSALRQRGAFGEQREGMDLALCILDPSAQRLQFAGAYNPLYLIRDGSLTELKADRMPIGIHRREKPFSTQELSYQSGDMLYLFSDGFQDQHSDEGAGGFGKKRFKQLLLDIHRQDAAQQREALLQALTTWKGARSQTDDVLVMGVRLQ